MADQMFQVNCGFFDSIDKDRLYSADEMNRPYKRVITNGVFATPQGTPSTDLEVYSYGTNMNVIVSPGEGLFGDKWFQNAAPLAITVPSNTSITPRIDSVIAQVDKRLVGRAGNIVYRTGTPSSAPLPPQINTTENVVEYRLANVYVGAGATKILKSDITDCRGSGECPWITSVIDQVDTTELFNQFQSAYNDYYEQSTSDFSQWSEEKKAEFEQWLENLTEQLTVSTNLIILNNDYLTREVISEIPIGITSYNKETDVLMVYANGIKLTEGVNYEVDADSENIILTTELIAGQSVNFVVLKSVIAADIQTTITMIQQLDTKVNGVKETTDLIDSVSYVANGLTDNIDLSQLVKDFYSDNYNDEKQLEINVFGTLGVFNPYSSGDVDVWFDFDSDGSHSRVKLNFANCSEIDIDNTNSANSIGVLISGNIEICNMVLTMRNCTTASIVSGKGIFHNCIFTMDEISGGSGNLTGFSVGTYYDCSVSITGGTGEAMCAVVGYEDQLRLINCNFLVYNLSSSSVDSVGVYCASNNTNGVLIMSGCSCPIVSKSGYKQDESILIDGGQFCLMGNILGKAASLYETGDGKTEVGTMIV